MNYSKLIFLPLDIPNPPSFIDYWDTLEYDNLICDKYRSCWHIPLMTREGEWTEFARATPELIDWYEENINIRTRIMIITTPPETENSVHIDCSPSMFDTCQHKLRYVFQGEVSSLTFCEAEYDISVPEIDAPFCMDGSWPHYMVNKTNKRKYTLAIGAPWEPDLTDKTYRKLLDRSFDVYQDYYLSSTTWNLPKKYEQYFEDRYK